MECLLPNIRDCPVCKITLLAYVETLGKTANEAVYASATVVDESDDDETEPQNDDDNEDDDDFDDGQTEIEINENFVNSLNEKISQWRRCPLL